VQPIADVSPPKWHLAHTTWFFEEVILVPFNPSYTRFNEQYQLLFNSYYKTAGKHWLQSERGQLSRPTVQEIMAYREHVDEAVCNLLTAIGADSDFASLIELGLQHEQQHQELLLMDIKYIFGVNITLPTYSTIQLPSHSEPTNTWFTISPGKYNIGHNENSFCFDNEQPQHTTYLNGSSICKSLVSNGDYLKFIDAGGYTNPAYWLSDGWNWLESKRISHPLYWQKRDDTWWQFTLQGLHRLEENEPVCHVSYYEAHAFANWNGKRLPTEQELEIFLTAHQEGPHQNILHKGFHPTNCNDPCSQVWCWSSTSFSPYPGYTPYAGVLQEYNAKFMCNQYVLRGGCVATPQGHSRPTYRNFYNPHQRWMFSGIRLATDAIQ
jgi:ergothioneine biosynthesis protein EgtB